MKKRKKKHKYRQIAVFGFSMVVLISCLFLYAYQEGIIQFNYNNYVEVDQDNIQENTQEHTQEHTQEYSQEYSQEELSKEENRENTNVSLDVMLYVSILICHRAARLHRLQWFLIIWG